MATAEDAEILTLCHEVASGPSSATRGPQSRSARRWGDRSRPPALHDDITGPQPRASTRLCPAVPRVRTHSPRSAAIFTDTCATARISTWS